MVQRKVSLSQEDEIIIDLESLDNHHLKFCRFCRQGRKPIERLKLISMIPELLMSLFQTATRTGCWLHFDYSSCEKSTGALCLAIFASSSLGSTSTLYSNNL